MENSRRVNLNDATHAEALYSPSGPTTAGTQLQNVYNPPRPHAEIGWICPVCGRGNAPSTAYCSCKSGQITYGSWTGFGGTYRMGETIKCNDGPLTTITSTTNPISVDTDDGISVLKEYDNPNTFAVNRKTF